MKNLIRVTIFLLLAACSTNQMSSKESSDIGLWQGKVQMVDETTHNKKWANVNWASNSSIDKMRVDVYALMDIPVATFIKIGAESHLWLFTEKKYYYSDNGEKLFSFLTKINMNPDVFYSLLGKPRAPNSQWKCSRLNEQFKCQSKIDQINLLVDDSDNDQRVIRIHKEGKSLNFRLNRSKVEIQDENFKLLSTSQFKTIKI
jgi:hypothetical protein